MSSPNRFPSGGAEKKKFFSEWGLLIIVVSVLIAALAYCAYVPSKTLVGYQPLSAVLAIACTDEKICQDQVILLKGQILNDSENVLPSIKEFHRQGLRTVCLDSPGGDGVAARALALGIGELKLNTCVGKTFLSLDGSKITSSSECNSACPWVMSSGQNRIAYSKASIVGFHASTGSLSFLNCKICSWPDESEKEKFAKTVSDLANMRKDSQSTISDLSALVYESYTFGSGATKNIAPGTLLEKYKLITEIR